MPTIAQIDGIRIMMFQRDHDPPHFHAFGADFEAKLSIDPVAVMESRGRLRARDLLLIRNWALAHRSAVTQNWLRARRAERILKIED
ncbi:MAG: DUF4160 domain-containing protein [Deltaproteobacteria bacterium]|nr:DUF4160 domain-containing protein [Deltaproteobacteria bacterium]